MNSINPVKVDTNKVATWLNTHSHGTQNCKICNSLKWSIGENVLELKSFHGGNVVIGGPTAVVPVVPVVCLECGNTLLFNPMIMGLVS